MKITKRQLRRIIREEKAKVTKKYDDDSALIGAQDELHDDLQKAIIDKTVEDRKKEKNESVRIIKQKLRRFVQEATNPDAGPAVEDAKTAIEQQLNNLYHEHMLENADLVEILEQIIKDINSGFIGEPT